MKVLGDYEGYDASMFGVESPEVKELVEGFHENFARAFAPAALVTQLVFTTYRMTHCEASAEQELGLTEKLDRTHQEKAAVAQRAHKKFDEVAEKLKNDPDLTINMGEGVNRRFLVLLELSQPSRHCLEVNLASMVVNAWTAFETFAVDLWAGAVNARPAGLGKRAINHQSQANDRATLKQKEQDLDGIEQGNKKSDALRFIEKLIDDREGFMIGDLLKQTPAFDFQRMRGIKHAYIRAFPDAKPVFDSESFGDVEVLDAVRNALVHAAGKADGKFLSRQRANRHFYDKFGLGDIEAGGLIYLDGSTTKMLVQSSVTAAKQLALLADAWIISNPDSEA